MAAAGFAMVALGGVAALAYFGDTGLMTYASGLAFGPAPTDLALDFPPTRQDRRTLPDGTQFFGVSGKVTNLGKDRHSVPNLLILLKDEHDRVVYSWEVVPPKRVLAPGEAENIIEAVADIPRAAKFAEIGWKPT